MAVYEKNSVSQERLVLWRWLSPHFNSNVHISIALSNIEMLPILAKKYGRKWLNMRKIQYLRNGWSYKDDLPLILTAMPSFL